MPDSHPLNRAQRAHAIPFDPSPVEPNEGLQGNRPAAGARQASPGQVLSTAFQGSATAGDFLGLDLEVNESAPAGLELAAVNPYGAPTQSPYGAPPQNPYGAPPQNPYGAPPQSAGIGAPAMESPFPRPAVPAHLGAERSFDEELMDEQPAKRSVGPQAAIAFVVGLAAVIGIVIGPRFLKKDEPKPAVRSGTPVASASNPAPTSDPIDPAAGVAETAAATTGGEPKGYEQPEDELAGGYEEPQAELGGEELGTDLLAGPSATDQGAGDAGESNGLSNLFRRFAEGDPSASVSALPSDQGAPIEGTTFDAGLLSAESWMSGDLVDMVWRDTAVPMEAIAHPARVMTPRVGPVRVHLDNGEVLEGRLYAVGQNRVWIESDLGRLGIDGQHVVEFEHLHPQEAQTESFDSTSVGTGRRVRVQVPGGVLYGRVLSVVDTQVTLITDEGARVVLESPEIEPLGPSRAILVER